MIIMIFFSFVGLQSDKSWRKFLRFLISHIHRRGESVYDLGEFEMELDVSESRMMFDRWQQDFEPAVNEFIRSQLDSGDYYIDIGSNRGFHALSAAAVVGETGRVDCFEPDTENYERLLRNISLNGFDWMSTHELALSDSTGTESFAKGVKSGWGGLDSKGSQVVETATFDDILDACDIDPASITLVKIDVEGAEVAVLRGMSEFLSHFSSDIIVEVHEERVGEIREMAEDLDRDITWIDEGHLLLTQ